MNDDWADLLSALVDAKARFLVVGAHALAVHGIPRATQDLDVWIDAAPANAERVWQALATFGAPLDAMRVRPEDLTAPSTVVQIGLPPNRIDVLTGISGVPDFGTAWSARIEVEVRGIQIPFLGRNALLANKRATGRPKDRADVEALTRDG